jgi:hypothetical protein
MDIFFTYLTQGGFISAVVLIWLSFQVEKTQLKVKLEKSDSQPWEEEFLDYLQDL